MKLSFEKLGFLASTVVLAFLLGYGVRVFNWYPSPLLDRALRQANRIVVAPPPAFTAPRVHDREGTRTEQPDRVQSGVTLIASRWDNSGHAPEVRIIDQSGRPLHRWVIDPAELFPESANRRIEWGRVADRGVHGFHLLPNGDLLVNINYVGTARLDACGRSIWNLAVGNHHSITRAEDGSFWIPGVSAPGPARSARFPDGYPGLEGPIYREFLLHIDEDGNVLHEINVIDVMFENDLERFLAKAPVEDGADLTHVNDVEPLNSDMADTYPDFEAGDLLVSLRFPELVFVVDPDSRNVKWHASDPFIQQHDPDFIGDGWLGVFDNNRDGTDRGAMLGGSRIVAVAPHLDSLEVLFPTGASTSFYTRIMGNWQKLENGNLLLTESLAGRVLEVSPDGHTVWEWVHEPYDDDHVPQVSQAVRLDLSPEQVAQWPCSPSIR